MVVMLSLFSVDRTTRYNCEVSVFHVCFICARLLIGHNPKVETVFELVSSSSSDESGLYCLTPFFF
jgi:hypothetical protein